MIRLFAWILPTESATGRRIGIILAGGRLACTKEKGSFRLARDDWKYYDEDMDEEGEEGGRDLPSEKQCRNCLHWVPREAPSCAWCGKPFEDKGRGGP